MAASAWLQTLKNPTGLAALKNQYDLVLTFDYENLNPKNLILLDIPPIIRYR
jgi:hypothetical protein